MVATAGETPARRHAEWAQLAHPSALALLGIFAAFVALYWPSIDWMIGEWTSSSGVLSHSYLIVAIAAFLAVRALPVLVDVSVEPAWWLLPAVAAMSLVWLLAFVANVALVQTLVLPLLLLGAVTAALGVGAGRAMAFAILYLLFAVPAWENLQFVFQEITIVAVHGLIRIFDVSAYVEGKFVHLPAGTFAIEDGCSGLNYVIAALSLAILYAHLFGYGWRQAAKVVLLFMAIAMVGNWIRVFAIVNIGHLYGMDHPMVDDHLWLGWAIFIALMLPVFFLLRPAQIRTPAIDAESAGQRPATGSGTRISWSAFAVTSAVLAVGPAWGRLVNQHDATSTAAVIALPDGSGGWVGPAQTTWEWRPRFVGATTERLAEYRRGEDFVLAYANLYLVQSQGKEMIFYNNTVLGNWRPARFDGAPRAIEFAGAGSYHLTFGRSPYGDWAIVYRYLIGGDPVIGQARAKIRQSFATLRGEPQAGVVSFAARCRASCNDAVGLLMEFVNHHGDKDAVAYQTGTMK